MTSHSTASASNQQHQQHPSRKRQRRANHLKFGALLLALAAILLAIAFLSTAVTTLNLSPEEHVLPGMIVSNKGAKQRQQSPRIDSRIDSAKKERSIQQQQQPNYHVVFSTSCTDQQHWESYVLFYHAWKVKQPGTVTRLLSGCPTMQHKQKLEQFHNKYVRALSDQFFLHFTPDFGRVRHHELEGKTELYKYMNKPYSLRHWMEHVLHYQFEGQELKDGATTTTPPTFVAKDNPNYDDDVIFLLDPDMILTKPLTHDFRNDDDASILWPGGKAPEDESHRFVHHGHPMAQQDGYLHSNWLYLNMTYITLDESNRVGEVEPGDAPARWNAGPPYILTARDAYRVAVHWTWYAPRVHSLFPKLFAEMFGYIIASAQLKLPHTLLKSLVVSTTMTRDREGWSLVDDLEEVCPHPAEKAAVLPFAFHYCKRYLLGTAFWSKYRLRKDIMSCEAPLILEPDPSIVELRYAISPPPPMHVQRKGNNSWTQESKTLSELVAKREAFMLCGLTEKTNDAIEHYKRQACGDGGNYSKVYSAHTDPR